MGDWTAPYRTIIEDCRKYDRKLKATEVDFLDSIEEQLDESSPLTDKQIRWLDEIFFRVTK